MKKLVGFNEADRSVCVTDGLTYKTYQVNAARDGSLEGVVLTMEGPDDPVTLALIKDNDGWKWLDPSEEILDVRKVMKSNGVRVEGAVIKTDKRQVFFGTRYVKRRMTKEEKDGYDALMALGLKLPGFEEEPRFFFDLDSSEVVEYGEPEKKPQSHFQEGDEGFMAEWAFVTQDVDSFVHNLRMWLRL
jgi:hypothetical protein